MRGCEMEEFYGLLTRTKEAIAQGIQEIKQLGRDKHGGWVVKNAPAKLKMLRKISIQIDDRRHQIGCTLGK